MKEPTNRIHIRGFLAILIGFFLYGPTTIAAATFIQGLATTGGTHNSVATTFTFAQTAGDLNVVFVAWEDSTTAAPAVTDTKGNTYTQAATTRLASIASQVVYYAQNIAAASAGANTVTVSFANNVGNPDVRIVEYSGIVTSGSLDVAGGASGSASATPSTSVTTANQSDLLVASSFTSRVETLSGTGTGFMGRLVDGDFQLTEDGVVCDAGNQTASESQAGAGWYVIQVAAFKIAATTTPYPQSPILCSIAWDEANKFRYAPGTSGGTSGSDIWDSMWASDGNIYSVWGDGTGFSETQYTSELGVSQLANSPASLAGTDVYYGYEISQPCATVYQPLVGKPRGVVALPGAVMYMFHSIESFCSNSSDSILARSTTNGGSTSNPNNSDWTDNIGSLMWPDAKGFIPETFLQYGQAQAGTLIPDNTGTKYIYIYLRQQTTGGLASDIYLARVPASPTNSIETPGNWQFLNSFDSSGNPVWGAEGSTAQAIWNDTNDSGSLLVTFDAAIGRYIAYNNHGSTGYERQVGLFDAPSPWGPWTTFDYEEQFDNGPQSCESGSNCLVTGCASGSNCLGTGEAVGFSMMQKWFGGNGLSIWPIYSSTGAYDSLNLIKGDINPRAASTVNSLSASTGSPVVLDHLSLTNPGNLDYIDRTYRLTSIGPYAGLEYIRVANNDKTVSGTYITFNMTVSQNVCVAWDSTIAIPSWLSSWTATGNNLVDSEPGTFNVYKQSFAAGTVSIPGANAGANYMLFVGC